jgi:hypothetical protein
MSRFLAGVVAGIVIATVAGAALGGHADEADAQVSEAAALAHVDQTALKGALNSLKTAGVSDTDPYSYLRSVGELPPAPAPPVVSARSGVWQRLAGCESSGNWQSSSNPIYKGGLQFDAATWARYGGLAFAWRADFATPAQQITVAERTLAVQGWAAWPRCSQMLGYR